MKRMRSINPLTMIMVLMMIVLGFGAISVGLTNLSSLDLKRIVIQLNDTGTRNQELLNISSMVRDITLRDIQEQQNQSAKLLPILFRSFDQIERIEETIRENNILLSELVNQTAN